MNKSQHSLRYRRLIAALKTARKQAGLTQVVAAKSLNKHPPFISKIEKGERRVDVIELEELCNLYGLSPIKFMKSLGWK